VIIDRAEALTAFGVVKSGLAKREIMQQSTCFVFQNGRLFTFNDEVFCSTVSPLGDFTGAVKAEPLINLFTRLVEDSLNIEFTDDRMVVKGIRKEACIRIETDIKLYAGDAGTASDWKPLPESFSDAVNVTRECAGTNKQEPMLTYIHMASSFIEATDRSQVVRYNINLPIDDCLIRADSIEGAIPLDMCEVAKDFSWVHFRNAEGVIYSCRRFIGDYPDLGMFVEVVKGKDIQLPKDLSDVVAKAEIFSTEGSRGNYVTVELSRGRVVFAGYGVSGWYKELRQIDYDGDDIKFLIAPKLLVAISKKSTMCSIMPGRLHVKSGPFAYVTCVLLPRDGE
jgi:hypothetical protein